MHPCSELKLSLHRKGREKEGREKEGREKEGREKEGRREEGREHRTSRLRCSANGSVIVLV